MSDPVAVDAGQRTLWMVKKLRDGWNGPKFLSEVANHIEHLQAAEERGAERMRCDAEDEAAHLHRYFHPTPPPAEPDGGDGLALETTARSRELLGIWTANRLARSRDEAYETLVANLLRDFDKLTATLAERDRRIAAALRILGDPTDGSDGWKVAEAHTILLSPATDKGGE